MGRCQTLQTKIPPFPLSPSKALPALNITARHLSHTKATLRAIPFVEVICSLSPMMGHFLKPSEFGEASRPLPQPLPAAPSLRLLFNSNWRDRKPTLRLLNKLRWSLSPQGKEWGESSPLPAAGASCPGRAGERDPGRRTEGQQPHLLPKPRGNEDTASTEVPESK